MTNLTVPGGLTAHDLAERKDFLTASEIPAIMGTSPWKNAYDIWLEKCAEQNGATIEPLKSTPAMLWGTLLEDDIICYAQAKLQEFYGDPNIKTTRLGIRRKHANGCMSATLDARVEDRPDAIECKTHATNHPNINLSEWGDEWTDCVPGYIRDQVLAQLACAPDLERVWVVLSVAKTTPTVYCIEREKHLERIALIEQTASDFWDQHIVPNVAPPGSPTLDTIKRVSKPIEKGKCVEIDDALLENYKTLTAQSTALEKDKEKAAAAIRAAMLGVELACSPKGHRVSISHINVKGRTQAPYSYDKLNVNVLKS